MKLRRVEGHIRRPEKGRKKGGTKEINKWMTNLGKAGKWKLKKKR